MPMESGAGFIAMEVAAVLAQKKIATTMVVRFERICARVLSGDRAAFVHVPYFFSDVFDLSYEFRGDASGSSGRNE